MFSKLTLSFLVAGTGVLILYLYPTDVLQTFYHKVSVNHWNFNYVAYFTSAIWYGSEVSDSNPNENSGESTNTEASKQSNRLFSKDELKKYDGTSDSSGLYLAILGEVFDVEKGSQHYKPGAGYSFFSGRDASRAYVTGDFSDEGLTDDVSDLDDSSLRGVEDWVTFYRDEYPLVGKVVGRYYDKNGNPTAELHNVLNRINKAHANKWVEEKEREIFPPCNSEWSKEKGSRVWCSKKSGGIDRNWIGVPRKFFKVGYDPRCVCVRNTGPPSSELDSTNHLNQGDLDHPSLQEYPSCPSDSVSCLVDHP